MSKQQSLSPDEAEVAHRTERKSIRKEKRWAVWMKMVVKPAHPWMKSRLNDWWRRGRYATIEQAEKFVENNKRKYGSIVKFEYCIRADELGKPE